MPQISVIVPVYKTEKYIHRCVDGILAQTFRDFELILVDDGSPDNCGAICDEYAAMDGRVRVIHQQNRGVASARNAGLDVAGGEYIAFVDSDDWVDKNMLQIMLNRMHAENADMAMCGVYTVYEDGDGVCRQEVHTELEDHLLIQDDIPCMLATQAWYYIIPCNKLFRRELFDEVHFPDSYIHEDAAVIHRIFGKCNRIVSISQPLYYYLQTDISITRSGYSICRTDNLSALADRICYAYQKGWTDVIRVTSERFAWSFFDNYFRFDRTAENEKYFHRMEESLKIALPYLIKAQNISTRHKVYLWLIQRNPKHYLLFKRLIARH